MSKILYNKTVLLIITLAVVVLGAVMAFFPGVNADADYTANSTAIISVGAEFDVSKVEAAFAAQGLPKAEISTSTENHVFARFKADKAQTEAKLKAAVEALKADYASITIESFENAGAAESVLNIFYVLLPCAAIAILMAVYMYFIYKKEIAVSAGIAMLASLLMQAAIAIIVRVELSVFVSYAFLVGTVVTVAVVMMMAEGLKAAPKREEAVEFAAENIGWRVFVPSVLSLVGGIALMIVGTPMLFAFGLVLIIASVVAVFTGNYLMNAMFKSLS